MERSEDPDSRGVQGVHFRNPKCSALQVLGLSYRRGPATSHAAQDRTSSSIVGSSSSSILSHGSTAFRILKGEELGGLGRSLSGEGVVSSHSVVATGLVSRHGLEFGTWRAAQF